jgi:HSP20 family protein
MMSTRNRMERMLSNFLSAPDSWEEGDGGFALRLPLDVSETGDAYIVHASIPGINPEELEINVENNTLTIRGETRQETERKDERWHIKERRFGAFQRSISLPNNVDPDQVGARYEDGVLTLTLPKTEQAKPRRINVSSGGQRGAQQTIEGKAQPRNGQQASERQAKQRKDRQST